MTTTSRFQMKPNFFSSIEECSNSSQNKQQTNMRYRNFTQTHFTAGDEEQPTTISSRDSRALAGFGRVRALL